MKALTVFIIIIIGIILSGPAHSGGWADLGLNDLWINTVQVAGSYVYAGTEDGLYRMNPDIDPSDWTLLGLTGLDISAVLVISDDTVYAGVREGEVNIYRTNDGGDNWIPFHNDYGGGGAEFLLAFERMPGRSDTLFAGGLAVVARSTDSGNSWQPQWGFWGGMANGVAFIKVDPYRPHIVWAGGEATLFAPWLLKSTDGGGTWSSLDIYHLGDNRCHDIAILPGSTDTAWVSMEGRVRKTTDGGEHWADILVNNYYLYGIEIDSLRPENLYLSGYRYDQPLTIFFSRDYGNDWDTLYEQSYPLNGALDIDMVCRPRSNTIYLATMHGVFRYIDEPVFICGDINADAVVNIIDIIVLIDYKYKGGPAPEPLECADANSDGAVNILDIVYLINYKYKDGPAPDCP